MSDQHRFYVTVQDGGRTGVLAGPFPSYLMAKDYVRPVRDAIVERDERAWFYAYGVSKYASTAPARFNDLVGYDPS